MRWRGLAIVGMLLAPAAVAHADADEASFHLQLVGGLVVVGDDDTDAAETVTAPLLGLAGRFGYATHDWFQFDTALTVAGTASPAAFAAGTFGQPPTSGHAFEVGQQLARLDGGVTVRLGVRFIPTIRLALGAQARRTSPPVVAIAAGQTRDDLRDAGLGVDLVASAAIGFDYRVNRRTIIGIAVGGSYAVPLGDASFAAIEGTVCWSRYWYPRW